LAGICACGAPADGSAGCDLDCPPDPAQALAPAARASSLGYFGRLRAPRAQSASCCTSRCTI